ncbi:hypothetical protein CRG98_002643, partial [Punica granatum]
LTDRCEDESGEGGEDDPSVLRDQLPHPRQRPPHGDGLREESDVDLLLRQIPPAAAGKQRPGKMQQSSELLEELGILLISYETFLERLRDVLHDGSVDGQGAATGSEQPTPSVQAMRRRGDDGAGGEVPAARGGGGRLGEEGDGVVERGKIDLAILLCTKSIARHELLLFQAASEETVHQLSPMMSGGVPSCRGDVTVWLRSCSMGWGVDRRLVNIQNFTCILRV